MAADLITAASGVLLWQLRHARERIWLASPYLSMTAAKRLVGEIRPESPADRRLLTSVDEGAVRAGVLSAKALLELRANQFEIRDIQNLHAKMSLVDSWGLVGSGNLTGAGLGLDGDGNLELGVELDAAQRRGGDAIFERWWKRAKPVPKAELERLAALPVQRKPKQGTSPGPALPLSGAEDLEAILNEGPRAAASRRYWIKANYHRHDHEDWWRRGWISDWRRASYAPGDLIVLYISAHDGGPASCPAIVRVMTPIRHDPEFVRATDPEAVPQWTFVTDIVRIAQVLPVREGIKLEVMEKTGQSLQGGFCGLTRGQFEKGARALLAGLP